MCGIAGIARASGLIDTDKRLLQRMTDVIRHRGPDDEGFHFATRAALGIRRLSIIDLQTGHQPVFSEDDQISVVLNGEIYNFRELRRELEARGHRFRTAGDTETVVHLYEEYGDDCVNHLRGMFAFALWDEKRQRLLLARDRIGIKPLFYTQTNGQFAFGSEIKCLLQSPAFTPRVNPRSLADFLTFLYVPAPATIYEGVFELPPAHFLVWQDGSLQLGRYWQLQYRLESGRPESYYVEAFSAKLEDAVRSHLVSDVPLGAFLSGGVDSGTIVALMSKVTGCPVETFTVGFNESYGFFDERKDARLVADRYQSHHHEFLVQPALADVLPRIVHAFDQPFADSSAVPNYYICRLARSHVTVALSGLGGDEVAGGYERYLGALLGRQYQVLPAAIRAALARGVGRLPDFGGKGRFSVARLKRFVLSAQHDPPAAYLQLLATFGRQDLEQLLVAGARTELKHYAPEDRILASFRESRSDSPLNQMLFADTTGYLPGDLLQLTDRMSMAHSLEVRVPFLDHELMELAASIPPDIKIRGLDKKYILKKAAASLLPKQILHAKKRGFSIPLAFWLRGELRSFVEEHLAAPRVAALGCFEPHTVSRLLREHFSSRANHENKIWALLIFTLWHHMYMEGGSPTPAMPNQKPFPSLTADLGP